MGFNPPQGDETMQDEPSRGAPSVATCRLEPRSELDLMKALERVFRLGVYYPSGHAICQEAAAGFLGACAEVRGKDHAVRFELAGEQLIVQGVELDDEQRPVAGFRDLLRDLGIARLDIDAAIDAVQLHEFVTRLLAHRQRAHGARTFRKIEIDDMPPTIRIRQHEFVRSASPLAGEGEPGEAPAPSLEALLEALARRGLDEEQVALCRQWLESLPAQLAGKGTGGGAALPAGVGWHEVEDLLVRAAHGFCEKRGAGHQAAPTDGNGERADLEALAGILGALGAPDRESGARGALDLLLSRNRRQPEAAAGTPAAGPAGQPAPAGSPARDRQVDQGSLSPGELAEALSALDGAGDPIPDLAPADHCEELSILLQMLAGQRPQEILARAHILLRDLLSGSLAEAEWRIAVAGARDLLELPDQERLTVTLGLARKALRDRDPAAGLRFLQEIGRECAAPQLAALWPCLVDEILQVGRQAAGEIFEPACELAGSVSPEVMQAGLPRLLSLKALGDKRLAQDAFAPLPPALRPLCVLLTATPAGKLVGERIVRGALREPPDWISEALMPLLIDLESRHLRFLAEWLRRDQDGEPSPALRSSAGRILAERLPALPSRRRGEDWVRASVGAVARLPVPGAEGLLRDIVRKRTWLVLPAWPAACREAAREALARLRERGAVAGAR